MQDYIRYNRYIQNQYSLIRLACFAVGIRERISANPSCRAREVPVFLRPVRLRIVAKGAMEEPLVFRVRKDRCSAEWDAAIRKPRPSFPRSKEADSMLALRAPLITAFAVCHGLAVFVAAQAPNNSYPTRPVVADVVVTGNRAVSEQFIRFQLKTRPARAYDPQQVQADVHRLASTQRFRDVQSSIQEGPEGVTVIFHVFERATVEEIHFIGNRAVGFSDRSLKKKLDFKIGDPLNRFAIEEGRRKLEELYRSKGFTKAQVFIRDMPPKYNAVAYEINEGHLERIRAVRFIGNEIASDGRLKTQIQSKPGFLLYFFRGKVDINKINDDVQRLTAYYRSLGFFNARVGRELEFDDSGKWLTVTFVITEGPRYRIGQVSFVGNKKFTNAELMEKLYLQSGEYFDQRDMNHDVTALRDLYGSQGHIFAEVKADPRFLEEPGTLNLVYDIQEGGVWKIGKVNVHIKGDNPHTRERVVLNIVNLRPGEIADSRKIRNSKLLLTRSQLFLNDPTRGAVPRVEIKPPELQKLEKIAQRGGSSPQPTTFRGQNPPASSTIFRGQNPSSRPPHPRPAYSTNPANYSGTPAPQPSRQSVPPMSARYSTTVYYR